jgi:hypothetical protein
VTSRVAAVLATVALVAGCDGDDGESAAGTARSEAPASPPPPPDAGTRAGHGADVARVTVPPEPRDPPRATVVLSEGRRELARASEPGGAHEGAVGLAAPRLRGTTTGADANEGLARVRVSVSERISCEGSGGRRFARERIRYFPPPQVERIRSRPGARLPARRTRSIAVELGRGRCGAGARPVAVSGELWGEAINGSGLEAVTPHIRFRYESRSA